MVHRAINAPGFYKHLKLFKMKSNLKYLIIILLAAGITGCKKEIAYNATRTFPTENDALLKINYVSAYALNPGVQLVINGQRVSNLITFRTPFPGGGYNTNGSNYPDYLSVPSGTATVAVTIPKKNTNTDSVVLFSTSVKVDPLKNYTLHVGDTGTKTGAFLATDIIAPAPYNTSTYKFVNMMPNVPYMDLYYNTTLVAAGVPYLGSSNYFTLPVPSATGTWFIRETGTPATGTALTSYSNSTTSQNQRVYTVFSCGYKGSSATNTKPYVSFLLNY